MNITSKHIEDKIRETIGHSPDIISDIAAAIVAPVQEIVRLALVPIKSLIRTVRDKVKAWIIAARNIITGAFKTTIANIKTWITTGFNTISGVITFVQTTVLNLLEDTVNVFNTFTLMIQKAFGDMMGGFEALLKITPEAMFNLQKELQNLIMQEQAAFVKSRIGG